jgi:nucleoside-triphosphatase
MSEVLIVSGERGSGKTPLALAAAAQAVRAGQRVGGLICPGVFQDGEKLGFDVLELVSGVRRPLARRIPWDVAGPQIGPWQFAAAAFAWGNAALATSGPLDLLILDELGPLEFGRQAGWYAARARLARRDYRLALLVVRPACIGDLLTWLLET